MTYTYKINDGGKIKLKIIKSEKVEELEKLSYILCDYFGGEILYEDDSNHIISINNCYEPANLYGKNGKTNILIANKNLYDRYDTSEMVDFYNIGLSIVIKIQEHSYIQFNLFKSKIYLSFYCKTKEGYSTSWDMIRYNTSICEFNDVNDTFNSIKNFLDADYIKKIITNAGHHVLHDNSIDEFIALVKQSILNSKINKIKNKL